MKTKRFMILLAGILFALTACSTLNEKSITPDITVESSETDKPSETIEPTIAPPVTPSDFVTSAPENEEVINAAAKELFEKASKEIILLAVSDPADIVRNIYGNDIDFIDEEIDIDGAIYYKTTGSFKKIQDYYAEIFTGDVLDQIISTKFYDVNGTLYVSPVGGATGWYIEDVEVEKTNYNSNIYTYEATFNIVHIDNFIEDSVSLFDVEKVESGYRISSIEYLDDLR